MYALDYLIYHLKPYGIVPNAQALPKKLAFADVIGEANTTTETTVNHQNTQS